MLYYFVNLATVLNKYLGLCLFSSKRDMKSVNLAICKFFCRREYFPAKQYEIPLIYFFIHLRSIFQAALFMARVCSLYHGVGLFSLIFLKRKGATVSKVLEKRESIVSVTSSSCSELLDMLRN